MTNKQLEKKIAELEAKIAELTAAMLALSIRPGVQTVFVPAPPATLPNVPPYPTWERPYIGDPISNPRYPTITCGSVKSTGASQNWN